MLLTAFVAESGGRRWLGDFPVTLYLDTPHSQGYRPGNVYFGKLFIHRIPLMSLQWTESGEMTLTRVQNREIFGKLWRLLQHQDNTFRLRLRHRL